MTPAASAAFAPMMPATCVPWPAPELDASPAATRASAKIGLHGAGSASGAGTGLNTAIRRRPVIEIADEVVAADDAAVRVTEVGAAAEIRVRVVDARVDHGHLDALALERADAARERVDADLRVRALVGGHAVDLLVGRRASNVRTGYTPVTPGTDDRLPACWIGTLTETPFHSVPNACRALTFRPIEAALA